MREKLAVKALGALCCIILAAAVTWAGWVTGTLNKQEVSMARMETKLDFIIDPNAKTHGAIADAGSDHD